MASTARRRTVSRRTTHEGPETAARCGSADTLSIADREKKTGALPGARPYSNSWQRQGMMTPAVAVEMREALAPIPVAVAAERDETNVPLG